MTTHTRYNSNKFSKYFKLLVGLAVITFGATLYILSSNLEYLSDVVSFDLNSKQFNSPLKTVELVNQFDHEISIHYDEGDVGLYLSNMKANEKLLVSAAVGQGLYATEVNGWDRIDFISIRNDIKTYTFSPHVQNALKFKQLNVEKRTRMSSQVVKLHGGSAALSTRFRSFTSQKVELWFDDGRGGIMEGHLSMGQETTTNSYPGHTFFITKAGQKDKEIMRFHIVPDQVAYYILDPEFPATPELMALYESEKAFMKEYYEKHGIHWRHFYGEKGPRPPPVLHMWPAKQIGDVHRIYSEQGFWSCSGTKDKCQSSSPVKLELEVVSLEPRAFLIENFISLFEADEIIKMSSTKLHHSSVGEAAVGAFESDTRTSDNTWITRNASPIIDSLYRRAADLLQIDESVLVRGKNVEDMQVVHYVNGQHYDAHHDWGVSGYPQSRFLTLLFYLTDMAGPNAGGETSFPKGLDGNGFKVKPKKGNAVLFYNLLEDGNGDDLALHAALPVREGEKWLANFWVWDPEIH